MPAPLFSIILPTKDRPELAIKVARHTLRQSFRDFELILVDNGEGSEASDAASGIADPRLKIIRTGKLNMPENWQAGLDHTKGENILMIEDKLFLVANALDQCARTIETKQSPITTWSLGVCEDENCSTLEPIPDADVQSLPSQAFFQYASHCMLDRYQKQAPRGINMLVNRKFALDVQNRLGPLCRPMAPDYSMGALLLPFTDSFSYINAILGRVLRNGPSTGGDVGKKATAAELFWRSLKMTDEELLQYVPLKIKTLHNLMVSDLFRFWRAAGVPESKVRLDLNGYFLMMLGDCILMKKQNVEFGTERRLITSAFHARPLADKLVFLRYAFHRFIEGWPNRKLRMRENLPAALSALKVLCSR